MRLDTAERRPEMAIASPTQPHFSPAITEIERLGFEWYEEAQYPLEKLDTTGKENRRVQVREGKHYAPRETVQQFAVMMGETPFPPIVVTEDAFIVDGNTRIGARVLRKEKLTPAIVLRASFDAGSPKQKNLLHALAATLNSMGGVRLTAKETRDVTRRLVALGWKAEQIGRAIGIRAAGVTQVKQELAAETKLKHVGLDVNGAAKGASLRALGNKDVLVLNDVPYRELATLAVEAGFNASEIRSAAKAAKALGSDEEALETITALRQENKDRIREHDLTGHGRPPLSRRLRQWLGNVTKYQGHEQELVETDPSNHGKHTEVLDTAIAVLTEIRRLQG
jgi:hypothetical protein